MNGALGSVAQLVGAWSHKQTGRGFDSQSGHVPWLQVWSLVSRERQLVDVSLSVSSLLLSLKSISMSLGEDF